MPKNETSTEPALPLCGSAWTRFRIALLFSVLCLLIVSACSGQRPPEIDYRTVQVEPDPPPVILTRPCPPLPAPSDGEQDVYAVIGLALDWADAYHDCAERHRKLVEATN